MYICLECGYRFEYPEKTLENHSLKEKPYEVINVCPSCKSTGYRKENSEYCHYCGARLKKGQNGYCSSDCKVKSKKAWLKEKKRKKLLIDSPLYKRVREVSEYNKKNNLKLSYGQYTAIIKKGK